jgi:CheY-like chemotaxis protein
MKKVLLADDLKSLLTEKSSFLDRADFAVFTASTNEEMLKIHRKEKADLIVTRLDLPGIKSEDLFHIIRTNEDLRTVSTIIICSDTLDHRKRCRQCSANAVFTIPVDTRPAPPKVQQFLNIAPRKSYRAALAVAIQGKFKNRPLPLGRRISARRDADQGGGASFERRRDFFLILSLKERISADMAKLQGSFGWRPHRMPFCTGSNLTNVAPNVQSAIDEAIKKNKR